MDENCVNCIWYDEITGSCTNSEIDCVDGNMFVKALDGEDMFKVLYMMIYTLGGQIDFPAADLDKFDDTMKITPNYDPEKKRYVLETSHKPPPPKIIKVPSGKLLRRRKRLIMPN